MKIRPYKVLVCLLFMIIFLSKMFIALAPAFLSLNNKAVNAVIMQLEQENKNEKEDPEKDGSKEKKFFDENCQYAYHPDHIVLFIEKRTLLSIPPMLYQQTHHLAVPTPPPNCRLV